ncbi:MAG: hypothetical protein ACOYL5_00205 [Phototrophicaceae bacterium]|jgi:hypothetical protein
MSNLLLRRLFVWAVSIVLGLIVVVSTVIFVFPILIPAEAGKGLEDFGVLLTVLATIPASLIFVAWLDYFLDTKIHPE